ncbi:hypothetical protein V4C85_10710 [Ralstonia solanacearum]|uniref:Uncharacterized protein n=1 Tax=Ralstonia solanacearum TaxID=305 RepID=A0AAW5ZUF7_RALSL|nr:hypothetical protein [Ralstonia solanacearum]MBB6590023.1 hypothetical protein [Ralstonia solanacearum]MBB6594220.1 hypothetical protein [Ralstonia solanacearum]MDB0510787.1 hypothetical protein [Ralstonia solanacearum]MDB0514835.1 hypothetical protein [Ralstonia solanacearum]MDB0543820.1 hypothetical protein [Ralstonia solanacearum]
MEQDVVQPITSLGATSVAEDIDADLFALITPILTMTGQGAVADVVDGSANQL